MHISTALYPKEISAVRKFKRLFRRGDNSALPEKKLFYKKSGWQRKREQVVAANIDTVFICMSLDRNFNIRRMERYLSIAYESGAEPVAVLTKSALCPNVGEKTAEAKKAAPNTDVLAVSSL